MNKLSRTSDSCKNHDCSSVTFNAFESTKERNAKARVCIPPCSFHADAARRDSAESTASTVKVNKRVAREHRIPRLPESASG